MLLFKPWGKMFRRQLSGRRDLPFEATRTWQGDLAGRSGSRLNPEEV